MAGTGTDRRGLRQPDAPVLERRVAPPRLSPLDSACICCLQSCLRPVSSPCLPTRAKEKEGLRITNHPTTDNWGAGPRHISVAESLERPTVGDDNVLHPGLPFSAVEPASGSRLMSTYRHLPHELHSHAAHRPVNLALPGQAAQRFHWWAETLMMCPRVSYARVLGEGPDP